MTSRHAAAPWPASSRNKACRLVLSRLLSRNCCTTDDTQILLFRTPRQPRRRCARGGECTQGGKGPPASGGASSSNRSRDVKIKRDPSQTRDVPSPSLSLSFPLSTLALWVFPLWGFPHCCRHAAPCDFQFNPRKGPVASPYRSHRGKEKGTRADQCWSIVYGDCISFLLSNACVTQAIEIRSW